MTATSIMTGCAGSTLASAGARCPITPPLAFRADDAVCSRVRSALVIRHAPHEGLAGYCEPIEAAGYEIAAVDVGDPRFASLDFAQPELLVLLGGPMGVYEQDR